MEVAESKKCVYDQITIRIRSGRSDYAHITVRIRSRRLDYDQITIRFLRAYLRKKAYTKGIRKKKVAQHITLGLRSDYDQNTLRVRLAKSGDSDSSNEFINACASVSNLLTMRFPLCAQSEMLQAAPPLLP